MPSAVRGALVGSCLLLGELTAQCVPSWSPAGTPPGADTGVYGTTMWDPDGPGPAPLRLVIAGSFTHVVASHAPRLAAQDPATGAWSGFPGLQAYDGLVVTGMPNGDLVVGGSITSAGGVPCGNLARWDGAAWHTFGWGVNNLVYALAPLPNGDLVVGGMFTAAAGAPVANSIARWNGSSFQPLGTGANGPVYALAALPNGDLVAGGAFTQTGGVPVQGVARWNGTAWSSLGGFGMATVQALHVRSNGDLIVAGSSLLRWDGAQWSTMGFTANGMVNSACSAPNGDLVVCGSFTTVNGQTMNRAARFDGSAWSPLGTGLSSAVSPIAWTMTTLPTGDLVVGGRITNAGGRTVANLARWDGTAWHGFGTGLDAQVLAVTALPNGDLVASGYFTGAGDQSLAAIGRWDGAAWQPLGNGLPSAAKALVTLPNGHVVASASPFGGYMAEWHGTGWLPMAQGIPGEVRCLAVASNGDVIAGGAFNWAGNGPALRVARWNGSQWSPIGAGFDNTVVALATSEDGSIYAGGAFDYSGATPTPRIARWDGSTWQAVGHPQTNVQALAVLANGTIVAGGDFAAGASRTVQRWTGIAWTSLGAGANQRVRTLAALPSGGLLAGGDFTFAGGVPANGIAYWDGSTWSALGDGVATSAGALAQLPNGDIAVGGTLVLAGGLPASHAAILHRPCAGSAAVVATACVGPAGPLTLRPDTVPAPGKLYAATARGFVPGAFAVHALGFLPTSVPLPTLHPQGLPGCDLLVTPDLTTAAVATGSQSTHAIALPGGASVLGVQLRQQCLQLADVGGVWSLSSSDALHLVLGW
jgi:hypothetical protein